MIVRDGGTFLKVSTQALNVWTNGTFTLDDGVLAMIGTGNILYNEGGVFGGDGVITGHVRNISGLVRPGGTNNAGVLTFLSGTYHNGDPDSASAGTLEIELGGTSSNQHDRLIVNDTVTCTGVLDVSFIDGFSPTDGDTFDILAGSSIAGRFTQIVLHDPAYGSIVTNDLYTIGRIKYEALSVMPAPTNVAASDGAYETKVAVTWAPVAPATGYEVWRNLSNDSATATHLGGTSGTNYDDTGTAVGVTNWYWVKATNATMTSAFSDPDTGWKIAALPIPDTPMNVAASDGVWMYQGKVVVTWETASGAAGYQIWRNTSSDTGTATQVGTTAETTFDDTTASASETNWYWVKATNPSHQSGLSSPDTGWMAPVPPYEIQWANASGGDFHTPGNWSPQYVPTASNQAVFNITSAPYTVTWSGPATNAAFKAEQGTVTLDFGGYEYRVNVLVGQSSIGSATTTADVTLTNGTLWVVGQNAGKRLNIRGSGTVLRILGAQAMNLAYPYVWADTTVLVDGTNAVFNTSGYSDVYGDVVATNGAWVDAGAGTRVYGDARFHISGGDNRHDVAFGVFAPQCEVRLVGGIDVLNHYVNAARRTPAEGRLVLDDATLTDYYGFPTYRTVYALIGTNAVLEGSGTMGFGTIENGGLILPGGRNRAGVLTSRGGVSNRVDGTIECELGGTNQYDRIRAMGDANRGPGTFVAKGALIVSLIDGFVPDENTFDLLDFVTMEGTFDTVTVPSLGGEWNLDDLYTTGEISYLPPPQGTLFTIR